MSLAKALNSRIVDEPQDPEVHQVELAAPEASMVTAEFESAFFAELPQHANYRSTAAALAMDTPGKDKNPTNDPAHATSLVWANRPPIDHNDTIVGIKIDHSYELRATPNMAFGYVNDRRIAGLPSPSLHTLMPKAGIVSFGGIV